MVILRRYTITKNGEICSITDIDMTNNNNHIIHYHRLSDDFEFWQEFDNYGNRISYKNSYGFYMMYEYDYSNDKVYYEDSEGNSLILTIDEANSINKPEQSLYSYQYEILEMGDENGIYG